MVLGFIVLLLLYAPSMAQETTKRYVIKRGDTLWDISQKELMDPFLWPKLWRENSHITNPDRIYPGDVLKIPLKAVVKEKRPEPLEKVVIPPKEEKVIEKVEVPKEAPKEIVKESPKVPVADKFLLASSGYITTAKIDKSEIVDSHDKRVLLGQGDSVYLTLSNDMKIGDRFIILRIVKKVRHPKTGVLMGNLVKVLGDLKITAINKQAATAMIINSYDYITKGDRLDTYTEIEVPTIPSDKVSSPAGINGYIVEAMDIKVANAQMDIVYLDKGSKDGLTTGDRFKVVLPGDKGTVPSTGKEIQLPDQVIGEVRILSLQGNSSTAQIIKSIKDIKRGDMFQSL
jgi:LysM repeat protein